MCCELTFLIEIAFKNENTWPLIYNVIAEIISEYMASNNNNILFNTQELFIFKVSEEIDYYSFKKNYINWNICGGKA